MTKLNLIPPYQHMNLKRKFLPPTFYSQRFGVVQPFLNFDIQRSATSMEMSSLMAVSNVALKCMICDYKCKDTTTRHIMYETMRMSAQVVVCGVTHRHLVTNERSTTP
jgi:hypothetical protein